ncbi:MAG TPA: amidase [Bryobacteraceae bacterium]|jgi:aspartyl-tRNA(Asn)/glutamyl-tRNA(Gln) amidotransferase subunit A|nr:amidase [Bryobacteraceae bacterium]
MARLPDDIYFSTASELNQRLRKHEFKASELVRAFGERLEKIGPRYNALALSLTRRAVKAAKDVDGDLKRERTRGPVQGLPFGATDILSTARDRTAWGAKPYSDQVFEDTATVLSRLDDAGALLTGKLATVQLGGGPRFASAAASLTGPGLNPWDISRWSGGPSSGSAIAVAAGLAPFALASEMAGSMLTAGAYCGVTALRPTYGLVSRAGAMPLSWTLDRIGVMARTAEDCGSVLHEIAGGDGADPGSAGKNFYFFPKYQRDIKEIRVGYAPVDFSERAKPPARAAFAQALDALRALGVPLQEVSLPDFPYESALETILAAESASVFEPLVLSGKVSELADATQIAALKASMHISAVEYLKAMRVRRLAKHKIRELFMDVDLLLAPSSPDIAPRIQEPVSPPEESFPMPARGMTGLIAAGNLAGLPAISLPCGFAGGMPVGIQFTGLPFSENLLLRLSIAYQEATDWYRKHPPV